ncbi:MAG: hypothetical protein IJR33_07540, partial [Clostridia bacterium]|nr:hypothetical protein [Clostridia bacterium]
MKTKRFISLVTVFAMCISIFANFSFTAAAEQTTYSVDFSKLVGVTLTDNMELEPQYKGKTIFWGNLAYEGTSADATGITLGSNDSKNENYSAATANGAYLKVIAPADGAVKVKTTKSYVFIDKSRDTSYGAINKTYSVKKGQELVVTTRFSGSVISELSFTPDPVSTDGYDEKTEAGVTSLVNVPVEHNDMPLVVFLTGEGGRGDGDAAQLADAKKLFDNESVNGKAILAAPQTEDPVWNKTKLEGYIDALKTEYKPSSVTVIGLEEDAPICYELAADDKADKIAVVNGDKVTLTQDQITAIKEKKIWIFAQASLDTDYAADIRKTVNALQSAQAEVRYTEYPMPVKGLSETVSNDIAASDWIFSNDADRKTVDLVLFAGQSNMAGRGEYDEATPCVAGHGYEYHPVTEPGTLTTVSEPFGKYENNTAIHDAGGDGKDRRAGDMVSAFMESYYAVSGVPIVGVQASRGGTESKWWYQTTDTANNKTPKDEAIARYNEAKQYLEESGYTIGKTFMVWCQGETDADSNRGAETWKNNVTRLFADLKANTPITDMFMVRIGHCRSGNDLDAVKDPRYKEINLAGKELADNNTDITAVASLYTDEYLAQMRDNYHYYQPVYNSVGTIAGNNTAYTLYNKGEWTDYPEPEDEKPIEVTGTFEITSSAAEIDITALKTYGADTFRVYKPDKSYVDVKAEGGKVVNPTSGEVTVVPIYRFNYTSETIAGYTDAKAAYTAEAGYGINGSVTCDTNGAKPDSGTLRVMLPEGSYDMNILRKGGARADVYNDSIQIINNTTAAEGGNNHRGSSYGLMYAPQIFISDGSADITIGNTSGTSERIASMEIVKVPDKYKKPIIWVAGDSESANYYPIDANGDDLNSNEFKITGFGMQLPKFLSDKYKVANWGQPSATVKTWYDECFEAVNYRMEEGDTIIVDFG